MAPVQATYLGYPNTTGVREVDWRIIDSITDPAGAERHCTERLWRMDPCFLCYAGLNDAPPIAPLPSSTRGHITFGSFNNLLKITEETARLWAGALKAVPGSRLAVKTLQLKDPGSRDHLLKMLEAAGLDRSRIDIIDPRGKFAEHLAEYANIDIALDTFPYHGTTTTCEAMWMGVPAVTLEGTVHRARVGVSLNSAVGLTSLIAKNESDFAAKAAAIAADTTALAEIRAGFRDRLLKSPLGDGKAYVQRFVNAMQGMWEEYCRE
jgi:predicted O-linked N-acetylglucosamine transferase (SPINDLY family)